MIYIETARGEDLCPLASEIYRYLGYQDTLPDEKTEKTVEMIQAELRAIITPKACFVIEKPEPWLMESKDLLRLLADCESVLLFCATLGTGADRLLQKYSLAAPSKAAITQAVGAAMMESFCDMFCERIENTLKKDGLYLLPRFSPGYGDFPLERQKNLLEKLDASRKIGVSLTESLIMTPTKSVSAVCGITKIKPDCTKHTCETCQKTDCPFRRI